MYLKTFYDYTAPDKTKWYRVEIWSEYPDGMDKHIKTRVISADKLSEFAEAEL